MRIFIIIYIHFDHCQFNIIVRMWTKILQAWANAREQVEAAATLSLRAKPKILISNVSNYIYPYIVL